MPTIPARKRSRAPYWLRFALVLLSLAGITSAFVLVVLPRRFVLQAGLVESGVTFPAREPPFDPPESRPVITPPRAMTAPGTEPGPAEVFWNEIVPLMNGEEYDFALPLFREYLSTYPKDTAAWREYAVALIRSGRSAEAEQVYRFLLADSDDSSVSQELARLLRDRGNFDESIAIYRKLVSATPDDQDLRHELALTLSWAEAYQDATGEYRRLLTAAPTEYGYRVELARVLYWDGLPVQAFAILTGIPPDVPESAEAIELRLFLDSVIHASLPTGMTVVEQARKAAERGDLARARSLYDRAMHKTPDDPALRLEWAGFLQYQAGDLEAARVALAQLAETRSLTWNERYRLAQLHMWTGNERDAIIALQQLVEEDPSHSNAWALLGDLYYWQGSRIAAADAYERALELSPANPDAATGLRAVQQQTFALIAAREDPNAGPRFLYFEDSDGFQRIDFTAEATLLKAVTGAVVRAGYRRLEGTALSGSPDKDEGLFLELEVVHWWRYGTVRTSFKAGADQLGASGTLPALEARVDIPDMDETAVSARYIHGRAFHQTLTFESVEASLISDYADLSAYRRIGEQWSISGNGALGSLHGPGTSNLRMSVSATVTRQLSTLWSAALTSQFLTFADSAPRSSGRRLYWDPALFWANGVQVAFEAPLSTRWEIYARLAPGIALSNERRQADDIDWVPQLTALAGFGFQTRRVLFAGNVAYSRGREGGYSSLGANLLLAIRY